MKFAPLAAALLLSAGFASPVVAQDAADAEAETAKFTIDTPVEKLMADERAKAVVTKHFGGQDVSKHPMYPQMKSYSLKTIAPFSQGMITDKMLNDIAADLAKIK